MTSRRGEGSHHDYPDRVHDRRRSGACRAGRQPRPARGERDRPETVIIALVAIPVLLLTRRLVLQMHYLEKFMRVCVGS
jgi:hypothetical protein